MDVDAPETEVPTASDWAAVGSWSETVGGSAEAVSVTIHSQQFDRAILLGPADD
jgi:hypothetical protein